MRQSHVNASAPGHRDTVELGHTFEHRQQSLEDVPACDIFESGRYRQEALVNDVCEVERKNDILARDSNDVGAVDGTHANVIESVRANDAMWAIEKRSFAEEIAGPVTRS